MKKENTLWTQQHCWKLLCLHWDSVVTTGHCLNVLVPPKFICWKLIYALLWRYLKMALGRWIDQERRALMDDISTLAKEIPEGCLTNDKVWSHLWDKSCSKRHQIYLILNILALRTVRTWVISYPLHVFWPQQLEWTDIRAILQGEG